MNCAGRTAMACLVALLLLGGPSPRSEIRPVRAASSRSAKAIGTEDAIRRRAKNKGRASSSSSSSGGKKKNSFKKKEGRMAKTTKAGGKKGEAKGSASGTSQGGGGGGDGAIVAVEWVRADERSDPPPPPDANNYLESTACSLEDLMEGDEYSEETRFSFTNEILLSVDCGGSSGAVAYLGWKEKSLIERVLVAYQNWLVLQYQCQDDISYSGAAITDIRIDVRCSPQQTRQRRELQSSGSYVARVRSNTLGNCRFRCPRTSLPPEDSIHRRRRGRRGLRLRALVDEPDGPRPMLVSMLRDAGLTDVSDASVVADGRNECDMCGCEDDTGECCGVRPDCACPASAVSDTYCASSDCNLPLGACCAWDEFQYGGSDFPSCQGADACLCLAMDCEYPIMAGGEVNCCGYSTCEDEPACGGV